MLTSNRILSSDVGNEEQVHRKIVATVETKEVLRPLDNRKVLQSDCSDSKDPVCAGNLPNNREMALQRLKHLKGRMESDKNYKEDSKTFIKKNYRLGLCGECDIHCPFAMGKARVTPLKPMTMPRLELTAALVSTQVNEQIKKELPLEYHSENVWTNIKVVLG